MSRRRSVVHRWRSAPSVPVVLLLVLLLVLVGLAVLVGVAVTGAGSVLDDTRAVAVVAPDLPGHARLGAGAWRAVLSHLADRGL